MPVALTRQCVLEAHSKPTVAGVAVFRQNEEQAKQTVASTPPAAAGVRPASGPAPRSRSPAAAADPAPARRPRAGSVSNVNGTGAAGNVYRARGRSNVQRASEATMSYTPGLLHDSIVTFKHSVGLRPDSQRQSSGGLPQPRHFASASESRQDLVARTMTTTELLRDSADDSPLALFRAGAPSLGSNSYRS